MRRDNNIQYILLGIEQLELKQHVANMAIMPNLHVYCIKSLAHRTTTTSTSDKHSLTQTEHGERATIARMLAASLFIILFFSSFHFFRSRAPFFVAFACFFCFILFDSFVLFLSSLALLLLMLVASCCFCSLLFRFDCLFVNTFHAIYKEGESVCDVVSERVTESE